MKEGKSKQFFADVRRMVGKNGGAMAAFCNEDKEIKGTLESMKLFVNFYKNLFVNAKFPQRSNLWKERDDIL
jgi:hypothetical protein